ncbi:unnamed protein product, partial [Durusdinium trenchii]
MASCGQTNRQDKGEKETEKLLSETEQVNANRQLFILSEEVSDFNTWYRQFESDDYQLYNELFDNLTVYRGYNDDKFLMLTGNFAIEEDARIFLNNRKKQPQFYRVTWQGEEVPTTDHAFFVYQEVGDYLTWLEKFQEDDPRRKENGLYAMG